MEGAAAFELVIARGLVVNPDFAIKVSLHIQQYSQITTTACTAERKQELTHICLPP